MLHSLLDNEQVLLDDVGKKVSNIKRLGSFFKPWYFKINEPKRSDKSIYNSVSIMDYFDLDKLKKISDEIDWLDYDNFIRAGKDYKLDDRHYFSHYISKIILNQTINSDELFNLFKNNSKIKFDYTYKLEKEADNIKNDIYNIYDNKYLPKLTIFLYLYYTQDDIGLKFLLGHEGLQPIEITFEPI